MEEQTFTIDPAIPDHNPRGDRAAQVMRLFGLDRRGLRRPHPRKSLLTLQPGQIAYITGPSGAGKTLLLKRLYDQLPEHDALWLAHIFLENRRPLVDCLDGHILDVLRLLSKAGLNDAFTALRPPALLSEGQQYRFRLARALAAHARFIFADEFCSTLDRLSAAVVASNLRIAAAHSDKIWLLASSHDDILPDLQPDVVLLTHINGTVEIIRREFQA